MTIMPSSSALAASSLLPYMVRITARSLSAGKLLRISSTEGGMGLEATGDEAAFDPGIVWAVVVQGVQIILNYCN